MLLCTYLNQDVSLLKFKITKLNTFHDLKSARHSWTIIDMSICLKQTHKSFENKRRFGDLVLSEINTIVSFQLFMCIHSQSIITYS